MLSSVHTFLSITQLRLQITLINVIFNWSPWPPLHEGGYALLLKNTGLSFYSVPFVLSNTLLMIWAESERKRFRNRITLREIFFKCEPLLISVPLKPFFSYCCSFETLVKWVWLGPCTLADDPRTGTLNLAAKLSNGHQAIARSLSIKWIWYTTGSILGAWHLEDMVFHWLLVEPVWNHRIWFAYHQFTWNKFLMDLFTNNWAGQKTKLFGFPPFFEDSNGPLWLLFQLSCTTNGLSLFNILAESMAALKLSCTTNGLSHG